MLVIVSDLHLTDGTTGLRIPAGAFRVFKERLIDMAYDASKRDDNVYKPIKEFDLVLLGDIFDLLRSTQWNDEEKGESGFARPWSDPNDPALTRKVGKIVNGILQNNAESLEILRNMASGTAISIPPPTKTGRVDRRISQDPRSKSRLPVKVNIHYMIGNHDWLFHLGGTDYDQIRQKLINHLGLQNSTDPFPHDPNESSAIQSIFEKHDVFARHGDIYDSFNYVKEKGRSYPSLGDALVVELFNPLPKNIEMTLGNKLPGEFYEGLSEMGSIRPSTMTPVWLASLLERHQVDHKLKGDITEIWRSLIRDFLNLEFLQKLDKPGFDLVDTIEILLKLLRSVSLDTLDDIAHFAERVINFHSALWGGGELGFDKNATREDAYQAGEAKFIVFGHTHGFKVVPLRSITKNGIPLDQLYINSGTWHPLHEMGVADSKKRSFISHKTMSYLGFYQGNERKGRPFETWSGSLAL